MGTDETDTPNTRLDFGRYVVRSLPATSSPSTMTPPSPSSMSVNKRELEQDGNAALQALVADYVEQANRNGEIPMHIPPGRYLAHIED
jgi:hypothetical protein